MKKLINFLSQLRDVNIHYRLSDFSGNGILVEIAVPGARWEVEFSIDGNIEVEIFKSDGLIFEEEKLMQLFEQYSD